MNTPDPILSMMMIIIIVIMIIRMIIIIRSSDYEEHVRDGVFVNVIFSSSLFDLKLINFYVGDDDKSVEDEKDEPVDVQSQWPQW